MNNTLKYIAAATAFASAAWAFTNGNTWPGVLAGLAGVLILLVRVAGGEEK